MRSYLSFRVYSYLCTGQITAVNPPDPGGGQGLEAGVRQDSEMGQVCSGGVLRKGERGGRCPGEGHPGSPLSPAIELPQSTAPL